MATATMTRTDTIKLEYGVPQILALAYLTGKNCNGSFGPRVMFSTDDDRKLFVDPEDGSDIELRVRELGIHAGEPIRLTKVKYERGGGHAIRVEREAGVQSWQKSPAAVVAPTANTATPHRTAPRAEGPGILERQLEASLRERGIEPNPSAAIVTPMTAKLCSSICVLIDAMSEAKSYAQRRGIDLAVEDLRALAVTVYINESKGGGR